MRGNDSVSSALTDASDTRVPCINFRFFRIGDGTLRQLINTLYDTTEPMHEDKYPHTIVVCVLWMGFG